MVAAAAFKPYYPAVTKSTPIKTIEPIHVFGGTPPAQFQQQSLGFSSQFNAVNTMVYSYAGALLFVAFLAEMRNPMDFWKGLFCAQAFICVVYLLFRVFVSLSHAPVSGRQTIALHALTLALRYTRFTDNTPQTTLLT